MRFCRTKWHASRLIFGVLGAGALVGLPAVTLGQAGMDPSQNGTSANSTSMMNSSATQPTAITLPDGFQPKDLNSAGDIENELVKLTDRALTHDDFDKVLDELTPAAAARAHEYKNADANKLNGAIDTIRSQWKNKYGSDLDVNSKNLVFNSRYNIAEGVVSDSKVASSNWPVEALTGQAITAAARESAGSNISDAQKNELKKGDEVALFQFPATENMPPLTVSYVHEMIGGWTIDVPANDRLGEQIYNNLYDHLNYISAHQDKWPGDAGDGYRMLTYHIVAAINNVPAESGRTQLH